MIDVAAALMEAAPHPNRDAALALATAGIPVFPAILTMRADGGCDKRPAIKDWQNKASVNAAQIETWWQAYPDAAPGIELGRSGLVVLDGDRHHGSPDGVAALDAVLGADAPVHPVSLTAGGGVHRIFRQPASGEPLGNAKGDLPAGIDVRGRGGWIVAPGAVRPDGRVWQAAAGAPPLAEAFRTGAIPELPAPVVSLILKRGVSIMAQAMALRQPSAEPSPPRLRDQLGGRRLSYGDALLDGVCRNVRAAARGHRNEMLNACAYRAGRAVGAGVLNRGRAEWELFEAAVGCGLVADDGDRAALATIRSGLNSGERRPLDQPPGRAMPNVAPGEIVQFRPPTVLHWHDNDSSVATPKWLVKKMLPETGVALMSGQWATGKTFVALHLAECVATGRPFAGRLIKRCGGTLFFAAEGAGDIPLRLRGITAAPLSGRNERLPFAWVDEVPAISASGSLERMVEIAQQAHAGLQEKFGLPLALIEVDTMAAAAGFEDENNAAEAQKVMNVLQRLARTTGALVIAIDHFGKNKDVGTRGSSAKEASADAILALEAKVNENGQVEWRKMSIRKLRGGAQGDVFPFTLAEANFGADEDGEPETTRVVRFLDDELPAVATKADRWKGAKNLQEALHVALGMERQQVRPFGQEGPHVHATLLRIVRHEFHAAYGSAEDDPKKRKEAAKKQLQRELKAARDAGLIATRVIDGKEFIWLCVEPEPAAQTRSPSGGVAVG
jgi:hypothetical protein